MFGDIQVLSSMGVGNGGAQDHNSFYPHPSLQNPSFSFMSNLPFNIFPPLIPKEENGLSKSREDIMESGSGSEQIEGGLSGNEQEIDEQLQQQQNQQPGQPKKKRYHRHTARQIQEMEALFKECPHPDDKQRLRLSQDLGLKPRQVKFWFQNRRTQMKAQQDRSDNVILRAENENLKNENYRLQAALRNIVCPNCGGPGMLGEMGFDEQQVRLENARLKEEFERVCSLISQYTGRPMTSPLGGPHTLMGPSSLDLDMNMFPRKYEDQMPPPNCPDMMAPMPFMSENPNFTGGILILDDHEKSLAMDLALSSVDELIKMCQCGDPLWVLRSSKDSASGVEVLNVEEYSRMFPSWAVDHLKQQNSNEIRTEASRHDAVVIMNSITLVDAFLDASKWMELFPSIVSRAKTIQVVTSGVSGHASGTLQLMYAELQVLSPLVPTRETHFLRYFHQNVDEGTWVIVDFPLDSLHNSCPSSLPYYKRRPSGCIIQDMPNGYSRVTWVEHVEIEEHPVHQIFNQFVSNGIAFGAKRWVAVLQRQCERLASLMARNIPDLGVIPSPQARKNVMYLAQRMIRTFSVNISTCCGQSWTALSDSAEDTVRITTRKVSGDPSEPNGLILTAVSTTWLPYPHYQVFELLRDERRRAQLDVLSNGNSLHEVAHIANGSHPGNCISLLRINVASNSSQRVELMLQESCTDESGSLVVYTTVDVEAIQQAMNGEDPSCIPLLPMGFVIHPVTTNETIKSSNGTGQSSSPSESGSVSPDDLSAGCLLTVGLQVLASTIPTAKLNLSSVTTINHHICNTVQQISAALSGASSTTTAGGGVSNDLALATEPTPVVATPPPGHVDHHSPATP
ncbi:OLC1v1031159C1 [Oldenlandia corymbosa var. corymbosa]|uniref:OLC1v1031159C1 n=1 Tax=Oldenlandia corymbosa var. corymbosa TaxID=529605 RepID=A0AAV1CIC0_OLDCO|nr:OLC1v1031159C1 [Oldenlandia corymbosa var. corymbosa]